MRILHLADLHLGKIFHEVHLTDDQAYLLNQVVDLAAEYKVDTVVITGDIYDRSVPPVEATEILDDFLSRIVLDLGIKIILIPGNHDSAERVGFGSRLLRERGLHIAADPFACTPIELHDSHGPVTFLPLPYLEPIILRRHLNDADIPDFTAAYRHVLAGLPTSGRTVCVAHCYAAGGEGSESERPLAIGGSSLVDSEVFSPFSLTLLGHLHRPQKVGPKAWYAGAPLRYSFSELDHDKMFSIFELDAAGGVIRTTIPVLPRRELRELRGTLDEILKAAESDPSCDDYFSIILTDRGTLFDYAAKIRDLYPNVLSIVRIQQEGEGNIVNPGELRRLSDQEIVARFYGHVAGEMDEQEEDVLNQVLDAMNRREGGDACAL
ncbi:nuclease SbcCD subunit D [Geobacter sp. OR-1]|uniref:exonuclease SbcCD subunit D n=1 Tax=Geobacter sp. OR-1 TaxID=1266765 RepID=UPI000542F134|nr:exonuclease SbcCD subunit D [Geobacter sp. OR-1]GAM10423.1 nuclease SbcCD subunit D [Geobacter sp. OR-1]